LFLSASMVGVLVSCSFYSTEVRLDNTISRGARWNPDHSKVAFLSHSIAWRNEKVLDSSLSIFRRIAVYMYTPDTDSLTRVFDYGPGPRHGRWSSHLAFSDSSLFFKLNLYGGWKWLIREDSSLVGMKDRLNAYYVYDLHRGNVTRVDSPTFHSHYHRVGDDTRANLTHVNNMLCHIPLKRFGLIIKEFNPNADSYYIDELVHLKGNTLYQRAIIEQIISQMNRHEIESILSRMHGYMRQLEDHERNAYRRDAREIFGTLQRLIESKTRTTG